MVTMSISLEDDIVPLLGHLRPTPDQAARELIVTELFRRGLLSAGRAAELLHLDRGEFHRLLAELGIPYFTLTDEDWIIEQNSVNLLLSE